MLEHCYMGLFLVCCRALCEGRDRVLPRARWRQALRVRELPQGRAGAGPPTAAHTSPVRRASAARQAGCGTGSALPTAAAGRHGRDGTAEEMADLRAFQRGFALDCVSVLEVPVAFSLIAGCKLGHRLTAKQLAGKYATIESPRFLAAAALDALPQLPFSDASPNAKRAEVVTVEGTPRVTQARVNCANLGLDALKTKSVPLNINGSKLEAKIVNGKVSKYPAKTGGEPQMTHADGVQNNTDRGTLSRVLIKPLGGGWLFSHDDELGPLVRGLMLLSCPCRHATGATSNTGRSHVRAHGR